MADLSNLQVMELFLRKMPATEAAEFVCSLQISSSALEKTNGLYMERYRWLLSDAMSTAAILRQLQMRLADEGFAKGSEVQNLLGKALNVILGSCEEVRDGKV